MRLTMKKEDFGKALPGFRTFFSEPGLSQNLKMVRLKGEEGWLSMTANDGTNSLELGGIEMYNDEPVDLILSWTEARRIMNRGGGGCVGFLPVAGRNDIMNVESGGGAGAENVKLVPFAEWPDFPDSPKKMTAFDHDFMTKLMMAVPFVGSTDARQALNGVLIEPRNIVATNGKRLIRFP